MLPKEIYEELKKEFAADMIDFIEAAPGDSFATINSEKVFDIGLILRDDKRFQLNYLTLLGSIDAGDKIGITYHLYSTSLKHDFVMKAFVPLDNPKIDSVERVWRAADWHEREAYDMMGIIFNNHHDLRRILCPYDWEGHPLRKNYKEPETYHGFKVGY